MCSSMSWLNTTNLQSMEPLFLQWLDIEFEWSDKNQRKIIFHLCQHMDFKVLCTETICAQIASSNNNIVTSVLMRRHQSNVGLTVSTCFLSVSRALQCSVSKASFWAANSVCKNIAWQKESDSRSCQLPIFLLIGLNKILIDDRIPHVSQRSTNHLWVSPCVHGWALLPWH